MPRERSKPTSRRGAHSVIPRVRVAVVIALIVCGLVAAGCTRTHYRKQADAAVSDAVSTATANPRFQMPGLDIAIDPRSRLYDPTDADRPPMPPDDPDSHRLMESVDGHRGWPYWNKDGVLDDVEVNDYQSFLPFDEDGKIRADHRSIVELARLNSRDFQMQLETLYLSALDVTAQRFGFNTQFYGGYSANYLGLGSQVSGGPSSTISSTTNPFLTQFFTRGGSLMVGAANSVVWQFSGGQTTYNSSLLNFTLSQPLLQMAGRPVVMELLTRAERNMLFNVRQYERYRQGFYLTVTLGDPNQSSLQRAGGLEGGSGLTGFTGVGVGGFGGIGAISGLSGNANISNAGVSPGGAGGYVGFLQTQQLLRNYRARNSRLRDTWLQLEASFAAGRLENRYQVDLARQAYYEAQSLLLNNVMAYQNSLDNYKIQTLGLPPNVPLEIRGEFFDRFNLIDPDLTRLQEQVGDRLESLATAQVHGTPISSDNSVKNCGERVRKFIDEVTEDLLVVQQGLPQRRKMLIELAEFPELKENEFDNRALTPEAMEERAATLQKDHSRVYDELSTLAKKVDDLQHETELETDDLLHAEKEILARLSSSLLELSLLQARARLHGISIIPCNVSPETAFQVALSQRADWMNYKASVVDSWRLIRYNANALRTNFTVNLSGNLGTTGNNPIKFSGTNGTLAAGVTLDPPLTRVLQRNVFRESLIEYQQTRRMAMQYRDQIHFNVRALLRQIRVDQLNVELRRLAVDVAITQTDVAHLKLIEPEKPAVDGKTATASPTIARDLVDALQNLFNTQQAFIFTWGDYESQRRRLDFNMGTMRLDDQGMWIDPGPLTNEALIARYYETCPDPLHPKDLNGESPLLQLAPGDLPPEAPELELPFPEDPPAEK